MAKIVLGLASSHSPQVSIAASQWSSLLREKDETDPRLDYPGLLRRAKSNIHEEITPEKMQARDKAIQKAVAILGEALLDAKANAIVVFGDDQHEQFHDNTMPVFAIYHGKSLPVVSHRRDDMKGWKLAEEKGWAETEKEYSTAYELAEHLIKHLIDEEFDVVRSNRLREEIGVGHAFSFLYRRILPGGKTPMVPVMVNTYYPPNQPTPKRCYALGQAVRRVIESWDRDQRVVVMASGGLSHIVMDEELDRNVVEALLRKDKRRLWELPREKLRGGTSEILNWVALAGCMEPMEIKFMEYIPAYRTPAATGCGMGFAYWQ